MKKIIFLSFNEENKENFVKLLENSEFSPIFLDSIEEVFENVFNKDKQYVSIFLEDKNENLSKLVLEIRSHLKVSLNVVKYTNTDLRELDIDNFIEPSASLNELELLLRSSQKITELMDTEIDISNNFYHFEFFKRIIHIEIKRAKRYGIELSLLYLTFNNSDEIKNSSKEQFGPLFKEFNSVMTNSIRDIDIPIAFGEEAILLMMPHTGKGGANIVAERIFSQLLQKTPSINFSISIVSPEKEELNFSTMMRKIHEGIENSIDKGGKSIIVK